MPTPLGLYVHLPFCASRCGYCDFAVVTDRDAFQDSYVDALLREATFWKKYFQQRREKNSPLRREETGERSFTSVYFGGGTPSLLRSELWEILLNGIRTAFTIDPLAEITIEANPDSLTKELLIQWHRWGVTRISLGVQSFQDRILKHLDRRHTVQQAQDAMTLLQATGIASWSLDLIYGLPEQSCDDWLADLQQAIRLSPPHVSFYNLILHPNLPTTRRVLELAHPEAEGETDHSEKPIPLTHLMREDIEVRSPQANDLHAEMFLQGVRFLNEHGYEVYELSNAAQPGHVCRHNLLYWTGGEWIGMGLSASSYFILEDSICERDSGSKGDRSPQGEYFSNPGTWDAYMRCWQTVPDSLPVGVIETTLESRMLDWIMLHLRTSQGLLLDELTRFGRKPHSIPQTFLQELVRHGYIAELPGRIVLTPRGWLLHSEITTRLMAWL